MLQIEITGINNGGLTLKVNGHPNNGNSSAYKGEDVHWKVGSQSGVNYIHAIKWKEISGSTDIFSNDPPRPQNAQKKHWNGMVNGNAVDYSVYVYSIEWVKDNSTEIQVFDPIISIKPRSSIFNLLFALIVGCFFFFLGFWKKKKSDK